MKLKHVFKSYPLFFTILIIFTVWQTASAQTTVTALVEGVVGVNADGTATNSSSNPFAREEMRTGGETVLSTYRGGSWGLTSASLGWEDQMSYCVEVGERISNNTTYTWDVIPLEEATAGSAPGGDGLDAIQSENIPTGGIGVERAARVRWLFDNYYLGPEANDGWSFSNADPSAYAFQFALWELTHDTDFTLELPDPVPTGYIGFGGEPSTSGTPTKNSNAYNQAQAMLTAAFNAQIPSTYASKKWKVIALSNTGVNQSTAGDQDVVTAELGADFGDAPTSVQSGFAASYPVSETDNGARHLSTGPTLGAGRDIEDDGQADGTATGDNNAGDNDEDGVTIPTLYKGNNASLTVNASAAAQLDAWIDWNQDGDWDDAGEQVATNVSLSAGDNTLSVAVPSGATSGTSYARFRLSTAGGLSPTGLADDGEIEDYPVTTDEAPIAVELSSFAAVLGDGLVSIEWLTANEINVAGFNVYRMQDDTRTKVNATLIPAQGSGSLYAAVDVISNVDGVAYLLEEISLDGVRAEHATVSVSSTTDIAENKTTPVRFELHQNYPNPFNPSTVIRFDMPAESYATLVIFDARGREVKTLVNGSMAAGVHNVTWDRRDNDGELVPSGLYFYQLNAGDQNTFTRKMTVLK